MKLNKVVHLYLKYLGNYTLKIMEKIPGNLPKTWKNHGNIMEFCQSGKVGTLMNVDLSFEGSVQECLTVKTGIIVQVGHG